MINPWQEGYEAFFNNIEENPYPILSHNWYEWDSGWEQAEKEKEN